MALSLTIENETSLPDGGPLTVRVTGKRGIDIGRDTHLDWTLPDPTRFISGKHCEVRYRDGGYWLHDVSTNGTFLYGSDRRLQGPHRLRNGDKLTIGQYIVGVTIDGEEAVSAPAHVVQTASSYGELWTEASDAAPPLDRALLQTPRERPRPVKADFLDWAADVPDTFDRETSRVPTPQTRDAPAPVPDDVWSRGELPRPTEPEPPPPVPVPRRPVWVSTEPAGPWGGDARADAQAPGGDSPPAPHAFAPLEAPPTPEMPAAPAQRTEPVPAPPTGASAAGFVPALAQGARVPASTFASRTPDELAEEIGALMRLVVENMQQLLNARLQAKRLARSSSQTMIEALDNNPLKFSPDADDALRIMFGPRTKSYLDARRALDQSFGDLKIHQVKTFSAMQQALRQLVADLDPQTIESDTEPDRGLAAMMGSRKARLWDAYVARWQAKARHREGGLTDVFMDYFAEAYDRDGGDKR